MLAEMRPSDLGMFAALYSVDPWGEERADLRAGVIASVIANVNRDPKRTPEPFTARDFMPFAKRDEKPPLGKLVRAWLAPLIKKKRS